MSDPRYSIIPAGAVTDARLQGRDLQVLCFLGRHTDKLGWCFLSQVTMAEELRCGRATVQRSLARLVDAGWIEMRSSSSEGGGQPYACHAYRVRMDQDDPEIGPNELEVEDQKRDGGCPPVGTGVPAQDGHQGAHTYVGTERPSSNDSSSSSAQCLADEIAEIAEVDSAKDGGWFVVGPTVIVQRWLQAGYTRDQLLEGARRGMIAMRKRNEKPRDIRYFQTIWQRVRAEAETPVPGPAAATGNSRSSRTERMADAHRYLDELANSRSDADAKRPGGDAG